MINFTSYGAMGRNVIGLQIHLDAQISSNKIEREGKQELSRLCSRDFRNFCHRILASARDGKNEGNKAAPLAPIQVCTYVPRRRVMRTSRMHRERDTATRNFISLRRNTLPRLYYRARNGLNLSPRDDRTVFPRYPPRGRKEEGKNKKKYSTRTLLAPF